jgi:threonine dehydratase
VTIELIRQLVDEIILVSEDEIARAIAFAWSAYHEVIEGSGAVSLAALLTGRVAGRPAVAVVTGGNIDPAVHTRILDEYGSQEPA